jgi:hypothetical protein
MYKFWGCLISLFSSAQRKKQNIQTKVLEEKEQWNNKTPLPLLSLVFGLLVYFIHLLMYVLVNLCHILFTIFYFISVY